MVLGVYSVLRRKDTSVHSCIVNNFFGKKGEGEGMWCCRGGSKALPEFSFTKNSDPFATVRCLCVIEGRCVWRGGESWLNFKGIVFSVRVGVESVIPLPSSVQKSGFGSNGVFWTQKLVTVLFSISFSCGVAAGSMIKFCEGIGEDVYIVW